MNNAEQPAPNQPAPQPTPQADAPRHRYDAALANTIEPRWQSEWAAAEAYRQPNPGDAGFEAQRPKFYCLDMFPYPSGAGLHVGHPEGYTATDIICRYKRMKGFNVLHPMGWDAFGLPAEQYAIQTGIHPAQTTRTAIDNFRRQLQRFGFSYDWSREFGTIDPAYYKWTQWIFLKLYDAYYDTSASRAQPIAHLTARLESGALPPRLNQDAHELTDAEKAHAFGPWATLDAPTRRRIIDSYRLAYIGETTVNWCPKLGTVLANDEVNDGKSERGGHPVLRKPLRQWMFRITAYADRLLTQLDGLDWFESTKTMQREWIGRSEGAEIDFAVALGTPTLRVGSTQSPGTLKPRVESLSPDAINTLDAENPRTLPATGFQPRDPYPPDTYGPVKDLVRTRRNLPHLRLPDATYFVGWKCVEGTTLDDADRTTVLDALTHFDGERCRVYGGCVMNNHVHWIVRPFAGHDILALCESVKHFSAQQVNKRHGRSGRLWDAEDFDHIIRDHTYFAEFMLYTIRNPVEAGVVALAGDYRWTFVHPEATGSTPHAERGGTQTLTVFTTRPDTIFGATYMVVAPEHPLCASVLAGRPGVSDAVRAKLREYAAWARNRTDVERQDNQEKTGVYTGIDAINPATGDRIPVWTADYVLMGYGTGAIMAVPAHDERDYEFAKAFGLPIQRVVRSADPAGEPGFRIDINEGEVPASSTPDIIQKHGSPEVFTEGRWVRQIIFRAQKHASEFAKTLKHKTSIHPDKVVGFLPFVGEGRAVHSANKDVSLDGLPTADAKRTITQWLEQRAIGQRRTNYKLRDWTFSRQRYWGEPFPIVFDDAGNHYPVSEQALPVTLPELADYAPIESDDPQALLAKAAAWARTTARDAGVSPALLAPGTPVTRECNTMPGSAGSSWYFLRYCDARNDSAPASPAAAGYWMNVDLYLGGSEHAVGHLLYSRFWNNVLFDLGIAPTREPFQKLFHQGMITSFAYQRADKSLVPVDEVHEPAEGAYVETATGKPVTQIVAKMSKSLKNVINPDDVIAEFGADTFRLYEMYMGPLDASKPWNPRDIAGCYRFLQRAWRVCVDEATGAARVAEHKDADLERHLHRLIKKAEGDIERLAFNTAIAAMIEFTNAATPAGPSQKAGGVLTRDQLERFLAVLSPFAPHFAEEVWDKLGNRARGFACHQRWPAYDPAMLVDSEIEIPISVMGKVRTRILLPADAANEPKSLEAAAMAHAEVQKLIAGKQVKKVIAVPGKMVNLVLG